MRRPGVTARAIATIIVGALLLGGGGLMPIVLGQTTPDRSEVVLVLDFSASILRDTANRNRFGAALERIADRVDQTSSDLTAGDATMTIVQFATRAADYRGCADLKLLNSPRSVGRFADCLRSVARAYRKGLDPTLTRRIGIDTNYVAAMEQAAKHLPRDAARPAIILFTDGKHDVRGVPLSQVQATRNRLFGNRSTFALLPVGMGLQSSERDALQAGLLRLQILRAMPACVSGTVFDWPRVVFQSPDEAGNAVAIALQDVTCTFTVAPPTQSPSPVPTPGPVQDIQVAALDGRIELSWAPPTGSGAIVGYRARCQGSDGTWIESAEGVSEDTTASVDGLTNGASYTCEVAVVGASSDGAWTAAPAPAIPIGRPAAPSKPSLAALDHALAISVAPAASGAVSGYHYECSADEGTTWAAQVDVPSAGNTTGRIDNLTNGAEYVCRAFAANAVGRSDPSPVSDAARPCGSTFECTPMLEPILGIVGVVLVGGLLAVLVAFYRDRTRGYVVAVVDTRHTANLGHGSNLGIAFIRPSGNRQVSGIAGERGPNAEIRIRLLRGGRFRVTDKAGRHVTSSGEPVITVDSMGVRHELVLRAFATKSASPVTSNR
jgi:hypothetical protein